MKNWENFSTATGFRDTLRKFIRAEIERLRPRYRYATVVNPTEVNGKVEVRFPGETATSMVSSPDGMPISVGQVVRVEGVQGDRYIASIVGGSSSKIKFAYDSMIVP